MEAPRTFSESVPRKTPTDVAGPFRKQRRMVACAAVSERQCSFSKLLILRLARCGVATERVSHHHGERADASRGAVRAVLPIRWLQLRSGWGCELRCRSFARRRCGPLRGRRARRARNRWSRESRRRGIRRRGRCGGERLCGRRWKVCWRGKRRSSTGGQRPIRLRARMPRRLERLQSSSRALLRSQQPNAECRRRLGLRQSLHLERRLLGRRVRRRSARELRFILIRQPLRARLPKRKSILHLPRRHDLLHPAKVADRLLPLAMSPGERACSHTPPQKLTLRSRRSRRQSERIGR